jgi:hypothetical protein
MHRKICAGADASTVRRTSSRSEPIALAIWSPAKRFRISSQA